MGRWEIPMLGHADRSAVAAFHFCIRAWFRWDYAAARSCCCRPADTKGDGGHSRQSASSSPAVFVRSLPSTMLSATIGWVRYDREAGAWGENALDIAIWKISLPGHWLHVDMGILNNSPIYFFALFGLLSLARLRDRRIIVAAVMFAATAGVNGLHNNWLFGHDLPSRFIVTALPVLAIGLAWGLPPLLRRAMTSFLVALAITVSIASVLNTIELPEMGYKGYNLLGRSINRFYPLHLHFFESGQQELPLLDIVFWTILTCALVFRPRHVALRAAVIGVAALAPFLWGQTDTLTDRLQGGRSPYLPLLSHKIVPLRYEFNVPLKSKRDKALDSKGRLRARAGHTSPGLVVSSRMYMPIVNALQRGIYKLTFRGLRAEAPNGLISGYLILSREYTAPAVSTWHTMSSHPLIGDKVDGGDSLVFVLDRPSLFSIYSLYTGTGDLALDAIHATFMPVHSYSEPRITEIGRISHHAKKHPIRAVHTFTGLPEGRYRVRFNITGTVFDHFFERRPEPITTGVFTHPPPAPPLSQGTHPPWWLSIPFAGDDVRQLRFILDRSPGRSACSCNTTVRPTWT